MASLAKQTTKTNMKTEKVKARKMWRSATGSVWEGKDFAKMSGNLEPKPVFTLPADADSIERMVEQMARAMQDAHAVQTVMTFPQLARAALAAIGVSVSPKRKSDKQKP